MLTPINASLLNSKQQDELRPARSKLVGSTVRIRRRPDILRRLERTKRLHRPLVRSFRAYSAIRVSSSTYTDGQYYYYTIGDFIGFLLSSTIVIPRLRIMIDTPDQNDTGSNSGPSTA